MNPKTPHSQIGRRSRVARGTGVFWIAIWIAMPLEPLLGEDPIPRNASPQVGYVGSDQCAECHQDQHQSFLETLHSRAAAITKPESEPPPSKFQHQKSGSEYEIAIVGDQMVHREFLKSGDDGKVLAVTEYPVSLTLGSGTHAKSYMIRDGDFFVESPLTYFDDVEHWGMSPGYDVADHRSFRRTLTTTCVFCHVGSIQQHKENPYKFDVIEKQIGCERCHGPGELHVQKQRAGQGTQVGFDDTILNPAGLSRELAEAICHQCHCQGVQAINRAGKSDWDFRPGQRLTDVRIDYQFRRGDNSMRLVGHVEQMHASRCYTQSDTLTCTTCHDPHDPAPSEKRVDFFREKCLKCHTDESCGQSHAARVAANGNDCSQCHMPAGDTNVSHFALHDHRIGIHSKTPVDRSTSSATSFASILDLGHLSETQQKRATALAKYELYRRHGGNPNFANFNVEATAELIGLLQAGLRDSSVDSALAWLAADQGQPRIAQSLTVGVIKREKGESMARISATSTLARLAFKQKEFETAAKLYRTLDGLHRDGQDQYFMGLSEQNIRNSPAAIAALQRSLEIEPSQVAAHTALAAIYGSRGEQGLSEKHRLAAEANAKLQAQYAAQKAAQNADAKKVESERAEGPN